MEPHMLAEPIQDPVVHRLLAGGLLDSSQLELARVEHQRRGGTLVRVLVDLGFISGQRLASAIAAEAGVAEADMDNSSTCGALEERLGRERMRRLGAVPRVDPHGVRFVAMTNPLDLPAVDEIRQVVGPEVEIRVSSESSLLEALEPMEGIEGALNPASGVIRRCLETQLSLEGAEPRSGAPATVAARGEGPIVDLVEELISQALETGASDLHFEPAETTLRVRLRRDGLLGGDVLIPKPVQAAVTARLKILGGLDVSESRSPQDGCGTVSVRRRRVHLRISTLPTQFGESVVLRLHRAGIEALTLGALGLGPDLERDLRLILSRSHGALVVTGPTGSGKTTTLYAILRELNRPEVSLFTLEDPVEISWPGVRQTQIQEEVGLTFGRGLRALLRQDPDVILVGETRDSETAQLMVRAALTGHCVLTSLHTQDAAGAIPRLLDLGVEPGLLPGSLNAVLAQRLVRRLCAGCRREDGIQEGATGRERSGSGWRAVGCPACGQSGYRGRMALFEFLPVCEGLQELIPSRPSSARVARFAREGGMIPLLEQGRAAVLRGETSMEELFSTLGDPGP